MTLDEILNEFAAAREPVTVFGARGFIGTHLVRHLERVGVPYHAVSRDDWDVLDRPMGHVIYAIGLTADYARRPFDTVEAHVGVLSRVLARGSFDSFVYLSSTRLYDTLEGDCAEDRPLVLDPTNQRHIYDLSKALGEALTLRMSPNARIARLASVYATDLSGENFLNSMVRAAATAAPTTLATSPHVTRDYVDVDDVVALVLAMARHGRRPIYNVASGENVSNADILSRLKDLTGNSIAATGTAAPMSPNIIVDAIRSDFGFAPHSVFSRLPHMVNTARSGAA